MPGSGPVWVRVSPLLGHLVGNRDAFDAATPQPSVGMRARGRWPRTPRRPLRPRTQGRGHEMRGTDEQSRGIGRGRHGGGATPNRVAQATSWPTQEEHDDSARWASARASRRRRRSMPAHDPSAIPADRAMVASAVVGADRGHGASDVLDRAALHVVHVAVGIRGAVGSLVRTCLLPVSSSFLRSLFSPGSGSKHPVLWTVRDRPVRERVRAGRPAGLRADGRGNTCSREPRAPRSVPTSALAWFAKRSMR